MKTTLIGIALFLFQFCLHGQSPEEESLEDSVLIEHISSYYAFSESFYSAKKRYKGDYIEQIDSAINLAGIPESNILLYETPYSGVFSSIDPDCGERSLHINDAFVFDVISKTGDESAINAIIYHELGHYWYQHPLKPKSRESSKLYELQADFYSGYQMRLLGFSLESATSVLDSVDLNSSGGTHPEKGERIERVIDGYRAAEKLFSKNEISKVDTIFLNPGGSYIAEKINELEVESNFVELYSFEPEHQVYTLYGEEIQVFDGKVYNPSDGVVIGKVISPNTSLSSVQILKIEDLTFYLKDDAIYSIQLGIETEVGTLNK